MCVWMWWIISMNDNVMYCKKQSLYVAEELSEGKDVGWNMSSSAVIKTINNHLWMAWLRTWAPNGDRARVSRCSEGDHEGHFRKVPQEEHSPSICIAQIVFMLWRGIQLIVNLIASIVGKLTSWGHNGYIARHQTSSFGLFPCTNMSCNNRCLFFAG
jgi:hypothetical protein